jgi:hypothetical protein
MAPPVDIDDRSNAELRALALQLLDGLAAQGRLIVGVGEEIAWLKGLKGRPKVKLNKPSGARFKGHQDYIFQDLLINPLDFAPITAG